MPDPTNAVWRKRNLYFLMGSPRSGTTWLAKILDTHPGVLYLHEPLAKVRLPAPASGMVHRLLETGSLEPEEAALLLREFDKMRHVSDRPPFFPKSFRRTPPWVVKAAWIATSIFGKGYGAFSKCFSPSAASTYDLLIKFVDWQCHSANIVRGLNPDRLIFIVRHPCAVVSSRLHGLKMEVIYGHDRSRWLERSAIQCEVLGFSPKDVLAMPPWEFYALDWLLQNLGYRQIALSRPKVMTVVYEELCLNPAKVVAEIFNFLGLGMNALTSRFIQTSTTSPIRTLLTRWMGGRRFYYGLYRAPSQAAFAWKQSLTAEQQEGILRIAKLFPDMGWWSESPEAKAEEGGPVTVKREVEVAGV